MAYSPWNSKRNFPRQRYDLESELFVNGERFAARLTDLSVSGMGLFLNEDITLDALSVQVVISGLNLEMNGRVMWSQKLSSGQRLGILRTGRMMGSLDTTRLFDILQGLVRLKQSGTLKIVDGTEPRRLFLQDGEFVYAISGSDDEQMGRLLVMTGRINQPQYDKAMADAVRTGRSLGTVLVEQRLLSSQDLIWAVQNQVERNIVQFMSLERGAYVFYEGQIPKEEVIRLPLNTRGLLYRGIRASGDPMKIRHCFTETDAVILSSDAPALTDSLTLSARDLELLRVIAANERVSDVLERSPLSEEETLRALYALMSVNVVDVKGIYPEREQTKQPEQHETLTPEESAAAPDPRQAEMAEKIEYLYQHHKALGYYGILEVSTHTPADEVKKAYHRMVKEYHPDRHHYLTADDLKSKLNSIFAYINEAYSFLSKPAGSGNRQQEPVAPEPPVANEAERNRRMAMSKFEAGRLYFRKKNYDEASTLFGQAIYLDGSVADYHYYYGSALRKIKKFKDAEEALKKAITLSPFNAEYIAELGEIYLQLGFKTRARHAFEKALKFDPSNREANEGIRLCDE